MHSIWAITKETPFYMADFLFTELQSHNIWRKLKNRTKNDIPNIPNYLHISDPNLLYITWISSNRHQFPWHFEITSCRLLLEDFFVAQNMHISEYVCKTCLKELRILLKYRETFQKFLAACNSSKNTVLPKKFS